MTYFNSVDATSGAISVLFIDATVQDSWTLLKSLKPNVYAHVLNAQEDGIAQITRVLHDHYRNTTIQTVYIVAHGEPGCLFLGNSELSLKTFNTYIRWISMWQAESFCLYSCNVAAGPAGKQLLSQLQSLLKVEVAASTTPPSCCTINCMP